MDAALLQETTLNQPVEHLIEMSVEVVSAYVANNSVTPSDLPGLISSVFAALSALGNEPEAKPTEPLIPAVPINKSVTPQAIICLEDGRRFKTLKRHLRSAYGLSPEQYRTKWGLSPDYPMVAPAYAESRSALAKSLGLGRKQGSALTKGKRKA